MSERGEDPCPQELLASVSTAVRSDNARGLAAIDDALKNYPGDARLHFLRGSVLAALERYDEARTAMAEAVRIAPGFAVARFQLGFLELTSGAPGAAEATWGPLRALSEDTYLRVFANGLRHMIRDEFVDAVAELTRGMDLNDENSAMNGDMQRIIDKLRADGLAPAAEEAISEAHLLLQRYPRPPTRH